MRGGRKIRTEGGAAFIPLTRGLEAVIDVADVQLVNDRNWFAFVCGGKSYAASMSKKSEGKRTMRLLHRVILNAPQAHGVDHRDGDGLNNCRSNLRLATQAQNTKNQALRLNSKSGFKGASYSTRDKVWRAHIKVNYKQISLGTFSTAEDAHAAYCVAATKYHGEWARTA